MRTDALATTSGYSLVYVIGHYILNSSGGFQWYRDAFNAGRQFESEIRAFTGTKETTIIYHDVVLVPTSLTDEQVTKHIDNNLLDSLEERALNRYFTDANLKTQEQIYSYV